MLFRAFKLLLGKTILEMSCRLLFGAFILVVITGGFWLYARQTEHLVYDQIVTTCRLLVVQIIDRQLATGCQSPVAPAGKAPARPDDPARKRTRQALDEFRERWEQSWPVALQRYQYWIIPADVRPDRPHVAFNQKWVEEFKQDKEKQEDNELLLSHGKNFYHAAVRASPSCLVCHRQRTAGLKENDLLAVIKIEVPTESMRGDLDANRVLLISTALGITIVLTAGSFILIRHILAQSWRYCPRCHPDDRRSTASVPTTEATVP